MSLLFCINPSIFWPLPNTLTTDPFLLASKHRRPTKIEAREWINDRTANLQAIKRRRRVMAATPATARGTSRIRTASQAATRLLHLLSIMNLLTRTTHNNKLHPRRLSWTLGFACSQSGQPASASPDPGELGMRLAVKHLPAYVVEVYMEWQGSTETQDRPCGVRIGLTRRVVAPPPCRVPNGCLTRADDRGLDS